MIINAADELLARQYGAEFARSPIGRAFTAWKVAYGIAIHANYTFHLPLEVVRLRWEQARVAERSFTSLLAGTTMTLWVHTIEAAIEKLEKQAKALAENRRDSAVDDLADLQKCISAAREAVREMKG